MAAKRILFATVGSLGDLHPYLALALELQSRGHEAAIATTPLYRKKVEGSGIRFHPMRPDLNPNDPELFRRVMDRDRGFAYILKELVMPSIRDAYEDLLAVAPDYDLLVSHVLTFTVPMVAEVVKRPWVSSVLAPVSFFSAHDPSVPPQMPWLNHLRALGPIPFRLLWQGARIASSPFVRPLRALQRELRVKDLGHPLFEGQHAPGLVLALFSRWFAAPQPDWPAQAVATGFPFYDRLQHEQGLSTELKEFLQSGPAPVVFTLGSSAVRTAGDFFAESVAAIRRVGCRAILLTGPDPQQLPPGGLPSGVLLAPYAPYSELLPHAAVTVHQGGIGTSSQALRAGRPMLVVPFSHDQPDNAIRLQRLGVAEWVPRHRYRGDQVAPVLDRLLNDEAYRIRASELGARIDVERGAAVAIDRLLAYLSESTILR